MFWGDEMGCSLTDKVLSEEAGSWIAHGRTAIMVYRPWHKVAIALIVGRP